MSNGFNILIDKGGQFIPNSILGEIELWMYVQKNEIKKKSSEIINNSILIFIKEWTDWEWNPWNVLSRIISRHHRDKQIININILIISNKKSFRFVNKISLINKFIIFIEVIKGHGLGVTIWKGWENIFIVWFIKI